ncbi:bifunctional UDP-sugar hydrolase/5'-nucleotidase [Gracilinema caldarium]|uniref:bifunctional metallophosphatase/5'-nucleotidase n=1 Tax=Gracilinema caldarium TaxID=215591 RepID=UPI0026EA3F00|nr:bifunctional UDP-sugar hydrolase/5'-nucleotidase [Gracilinema caldarium]
MRKDQLRWFGKLGLVLLSLFLVFGCASAPNKAAQGKQIVSVQEQYSVTPLEITFIETSDVHGVIFPYNFITAKAMPTSLAQVSSLVSDLRNTKKHVVLLENGDSLQGQPTVYYYNFEKTSVPHIWGQALNYLKYDAVGVGNHDIEAGHAVYDKLYKEIKAPVICANILKENGEPYFKPYTIIERGGVKIAILGLITPKIPDWLPPQFWSGMKFEDMVVSAKKWVPIIMEKEKPDVLIGLFHAGVDYTYSGASRDTVSNENASQLVAEQVPGFDIIFVGHDHAGWDGMGWDPVAKKKAEVKDSTGKTVYIYGALNNAVKIPVVTLSLLWDKDAKVWKKTIQGELKDMKDVSADTAFVSQFQPAYDEIKAWVDRPVGKMLGSITTRDSMFGDSVFVDLIHRIQLELCADPAMGLKKADISFAAPLAMNATIPSSADGTLYVRDMFNLYVYENFLYTMNLTGKQVKDFLEYSYQYWFDTMPNEGNHIIAFQKDKDGKLVQDARTGSYLTATRYYNYDSAAGINYTVDVSKPAGSRVNILSMADGTPFDMNKTYSVAINSYRAQGGGGHLEKGAGLSKGDILAMKYVTSATTKDLRFYLLKWFEKQQGAVSVQSLNNWKVIPEELATTGKTNDMPLLYPTK